VRTAIVEGCTIKVYAIKWLSILLNKHTNTIRQWESEGVLPRPILDLGDSYRWYTALEVEYYVRLFRSIKTRPGCGFKRLGVAQAAQQIKDSIRRAMAKDIKVLQKPLSREEEILKAKSIKKVVQWKSDVEELLNTPEAKLIQSLPAKRQQKIKQKAG
jgi:DNA-binding transcriptional MerR regulator